MDLETLGERVKKARVAQRWAVVDAAKEAGVARDTWKRVEQGKDVRDINRRAVLAFLGLDDDGLPPAETATGGVSGPEEVEAILNPDPLEVFEKRLEDLLDDVRAYRRTGRQGGLAGARAAADAAGEESQDPGGEA